jgi:transcriptional regulator with XRE-family HTH domain
VARQATERRVLVEIGARIRSAREGAGLSQEDAAHRAGIGAKRWQQLEYGNVNVTVRTLWRVATACRTDFWSLLSKPS